MATITNHTPAQSAALAHCRNCNRMVGFHYHPINHWVQLLVTILTVGIWLPIWLTMIFGRTRLCNECNSPIFRD